MAAARFPRMGPGSPPIRTGLRCAPSPGASTLDHHRPGSPPLDPEGNPRLPCKTTRPPPSMTQPSPSRSSRAASRWRRRSPRSPRSVSPMVKARASPTAARTPIAPAHPPGSTSSKAHVSRSPERASSGLGLTGGHALLCLEDALRPTGVPSRTGRSRGSVRRVARPPTELWGASSSRAARRETHGVREGRGRRARPLPETEVRSLGAAGSRVVSWTLTDVGCRQRAAVPRRSTAPRPARRSRASTRPCESSRLNYGLLRGGLRSRLVLSPPARLGAAPPPFLGRCSGAGEQAGPSSLNHYRGPSDVQRLPESAHNPLTPTAP